MCDIHRKNIQGGGETMTTLIVGFMVLVLVPALVLSVVLPRMTRRPAEFCMQDDCPKFTISSK
jgi:hypothetical protein